MSTNTSINTIVENFGGWVTGTIGGTVTKTLGAIALLIFIVMLFAYVVTKGKGDVKIGWLIGAFVVGCLFSALGWGVLDSTQEVVSGTFYEATQIPKS